MLPTCFHHVTLYLSSASFILTTIFVLQSSISTASSILVKRPVFSLPAALPPSVASSYSGAPLTEPVCDPVFGFPKPSECFCAMEAMERDPAELLRTTYHGPNFPMDLNFRNVANFDGTITRWANVPLSFFVETPRIYSCGTCLITIYPLSDGESDMALKRTVRNTAGGIIMSCTLHIGGTGGVNIAGENRKLWISVFDVPSLDGKLQHKQARTNDPAIVKHMKDFCRWPPTGPTTASQDNFQMLTCGDSSQQAGGGGGGGGGGGEGGGAANKETEEALRAELIETMGEKACTLEGVGDGRGACGDGWVCRAQAWVDKAEEILFGLGSMMGTGICGLAS